MDKQQLVRQYVQRQRAYAPTYTAEHLLNERPGTPAKQIQSDQFGFDTPILRPRVAPSKSPARESTDPEPSLGKDKPRPKRKKASTPVDTDNERAARLADRRERKRNKRAIVNPPQKHDEDNEHTTASKKGRTKGQKTKKPAALALLYGFSATNVTKDRLTVKPAPSLGVFSKGKASEKKKVAATTKKSSSKNEIFSEFAFLNKSSADHSRVVDHSDDSFVSSTSHHTSQATRGTKRTKKDRGKCAETMGLKGLHASTGTTAESEVWDIELQSKLPSSALGVSSESGANDSASVVFNLCGAEWSASLNAVGEHEERDDNRRMSITRSLSMRHPTFRSSSLARSDLCNELGVPHAVDEAPSIHPSHSASQVGRHAADIQPSDLWWPARSKYFAHPEPAIIQQFAEASKSNDNIDVLNSRSPDQDVQTTFPVNSLVSAVQPLAEFRSQYDVAPLEFPSDCSYDDYDGAMERLGDHGNFESSVVDMQGDRFIGDPHCDVDVDRPGVEYFDLQRDVGCQCQCCASPGLADDDAAHDMVQGYDPLAVEHENDLEGPEGVCARYEDEGDGESGGGMPEFFEGRALLLGFPEWPRREGLSGLAQAEMDVAGRLRDHWRPHRLR